MRRPRLEDIEWLISSSGIDGVVSEHLPSGGRPRQLPVASVLVGIALALSRGRPAQLSAAYEELICLPLKDQLRLKVSVRRRGGITQVSYRAFADTFSVLCEQMDASPVPSFRGCGVGERAARLLSHREAVPAESRRQRLIDVLDRLVEASIPARYKASSDLAVDWTDHETWSRPRPVTDPEPPADPDASFGHAKRNAPGAKDGLFFGYYAQAATMVGPLSGKPVPELVRRIVFASPKSDPPKLMADALKRLSAGGLGLKEVICDCGYSNRDPANFARPVRRAGGRLVMDLHPNDRGKRGTYEGAILANGQLYCPLTPESLMKIGPLSSAASPEDVRAHDEALKELSAYRLAVVNAPDADGYMRVSCPAVAGKLACPRRPESMRLGLERPRVEDPPDYPCRCCDQKTMIVPPQVNEKTRQAYDYPGPEFKRAYARRTAAERTFASLADASVGGIRRGWCRLFGLTKNSLMYALCVVVRNMRTVASFEESLQDASPNKGRKRRRRRYQRDEDILSETSGDGEPIDSG